MMSLARARKLNSMYAGSSSYGKLEKFTAAASARKEALTVAGTGAAASIGLGLARRAYGDNYDIKGFPMELTIGIAGLALALYGQEWLSKSKMLGGATQSVLEGVATAGIGAGLYRLAEAGKLPGQS